MRREEIENIVEETLAQLKDFQRKTVNTVYDRLYKEGHKKHLVADEVGLGKTIVAKGLIAKALHDQFTADENDPFRVVYICSNQALAGQNLKKLNILKDSGSSKMEVGRLIFKAFKDEDDSIFKLTSLTPTTSFRLIRGSGVQYERLLMYSILSELDEFQSHERDQGLRLALIGYVDNIESWLSRCDSYKQKNLAYIRDEVLVRFPEVLKREKLKKKDFPKVYKELGVEEEITIFDILLKYSDVLIPNYEVVRNQYWYHRSVLSKLRSILTEICLDFIDADLYILDEFQRFNDLIDTEDKEFEKLSEAAAIAKKIFEKAEAKVLMLSATPFKQYATKAEEENEEEHYKEFLTVLKFLLKDELSIERFKKNRKQFFDLLRRPETIAFEDDDKRQNQLVAKYELEELFRKVMSRTERLIVSDDKNTLVKDKLNDVDYSSEIKLRPQDITDFIASDRMVQALNEVTDRSVNNVLGYVLSSPYPFSFLDRYKVKEVLNQNKHLGNLPLTIRKQRKGWIDWDLIQHYKSLGELPNGKLRVLMKDTMETGLWKRLWLNPSLTYYKPEGAFEDAVNDSKTLIFSKWVMVPKMIASTLSYEAERLTIGDKASYRSEKEDRVYSPPLKVGQKKREPRKPTKILNIRMKEGRADRMSAFNLLYPSLTFSLGDEFNPAQVLDEDLSLDELKERYKRKIQTLIDDYNLDQFCIEQEDSRKWYWVAPILLDKLIHPKDSEVAIKYVGASNSEFIRGAKESRDPDELEDDENFEGGAASKHFEELKVLFENPEEYPLGPLPDDLAEVLSEVVVGSPANALFRLLNHYFVDEPIKRQFAASLDLAMEFYRLFDKPESIATLTLTCPGDQYYWRQVLYYCASGNIQSMLDEFGHMINGDAKTLDSFVKRLSSTINFNTASVKVDSYKSFLNNEELRMRCHFAVDFGNQDMEDEKGRNRIVNVLDNFNSPFRPFVLASTSIGQEGLDFHYYCRKIVHWNLPSNPIDFEQREGRINRFKGLVIRQNIVKKYRHLLDAGINDYWVKLFQIARAQEGEGQNSKPELVPFWHVEGDDIHIERIAPVLPYSKEVSHLKKLIAALTLYRLTFGQPRQEELVESLFKQLSSEEVDLVRKELMIDLSPISYRN